MQTKTKNRRIITENTNNWIGQIKYLGLAVSLHPIGSARWPIYEYKSKFNSTEIAIKNFKSLRFKCSVLKLFSLFPDVK